jgi:hypothetical protein
MAERDQAQRAAAELAGPTAAVEQLLQEFAKQPLTGPRARIITTTMSRMLDAAAGSFKARHTRMRARDAFAAAAAYMHRAHAANPHLEHTPATTAPWPGWRDDLAQLRIEHPEWSSGIDQDAAYLARYEAAILFEASTVAKLSNALNEALPHCQADELCELIRELDQQWASFSADQPSTPAVATMTPQGHA